jgi:L-aspartate oxidase
LNIKTDFLIIGSGVSGLSSAIKLCKYGKVLILSKKNVSETNTFYAQGGIACVWDEKDTFKSHINDTIIAGDELCDKLVVENVIKQAPQRIQELIDYGISFTKDANGLYSLGQEGGHSKRRILHVNDLTGRAVQNTLMAKIKELDNIEIREDNIAINLFAKDRVCLGAYVLDKKNNQIYNISAKFTILASGGVGKIYIYTSNPDIASGDGVAMAYRVGATIANMEFTQFHPTCLYHPFAKSFLLTEALRGEGAILKDKKGHRFMEKYHKLNELAPRDIVSRAIDFELKRTGDDYVYLDIASIKPPSFIKEHFPGIYEECLRYNIDITKEPIPVVPAAHYCCGGVKVDLNGQSDIKNLFAIGEVSCTGLHGANRLASNSIIEGLAFAHNCAEFLKDKMNTAKCLSFPPWEHGNAVDSTEAVVISQNWEEIRRFMWNYVGIVRTDKRLQRAKKRINLLLDEINQYYWDFKITGNLVELRNLATVAKIIIVSAISRKESRGIHFNLDYPNKSDIPRNTLIRVPW